MKKNDVKKMIGVILLLGLLLTGCGDEIPQKVITPEQETLEQETIEQSSVIEETTQVSENKEQEEVIFTDKNIWELEEGEVALANSYQETDIEVWGNYEDDKLIIKDGDIEFELDLMWHSVRYEEPEIIKSDFNGDGQNEYLLSTVTATGTGVNIGQLYLITGAPDNIKVIEYDYDKILEDLNTRITADYDEGDLKTVTVKADEEKIGELIIDNMVKNFGDYRSLSIGDILTFQFENNEAYLNFEAGICYEEVTPPQYEAAIDFKVPVSISENNEFVLGKITGTTSYWGDYIEEMWGLSDDNKENCEIINTYYYDLNHDEKMEKIVVYGQVLEGYANAFECLESGVGVGFVSIYSLDEENEYTNLLWEKEFSTPHSGNAQFSIVEKNGKNFLLETDVWRGQGSYIYNYKVTVLCGDMPSYEYVIDSYELEYREEENKNPSEFYEGLNKWMDEEAVLLVATEIDSTPDLWISTPERLLNPNAFYEYLKNLRQSW